VRVAISILDDITKDHGATVRAKRMYEVMKRYFDITLITWSTRRLDNSTPSILIRLPNTRLITQLPFWLSGEALALLRNRFDLIYSCNDWYGFIICYFLSKIHSCPIVFEAHGILSEEYEEYSQSKSTIRFGFRIGYYARRLLECFVVKRSQMVIALSHRIFDFYVQYNPNTKLIPVFIDTNHYKFNPEKKRKFRQKYGLSNTKLIGVIGPFYSIFNSPSLEFIYENIDKFDSRINFMIIGPCPFKKEHKRIIYTGFVEDYAGILSCLDAVLVPCKIFTSGPLNKIIEAMSCSLPVFTTPKGLIGLDYAENGKNIFVYEENELVEKINVSVFDDDLMIEVSVNAVKTVKEHYSKEVNEKRLLRFIMAGCVA
jgi:glycosyltransferase involved in cell wall biosynthesis